MSEILKIFLENVPEWMIGISIGYLLIQVAYLMKALTLYYKSKAKKNFIDIDPSEDDRA